MSKKWIKKGSQENVEAPAEELITSPILLEASTGPSYDRFFMLSVATAVKKQDVADSQPTKTREQQQRHDSRTSTQSSPQSREVSLTMRPSETAEKELSASERQQQRNFLKQAKAARRSNSGLFIDDDEGGNISVNAPMSPAVSGMADPAMMAYLQSMTYAMNPMMAAYGANPAGYTTVMLRNIPNRYTREMLVERLDKNYKAQYDFLYLPIDFESKCNVGYVFINFRNPFSAAAFLTEYHNAETKQVLPGFSSRKVCEVSYARVQGLDANIENLRDEKFIEKLSEKPEWQPLFLDEKGNEIPFARMMGKKRPGGKTPKGGLTPGTPGAIGGFMMPTPYGPMMYPPMMPAMPSVPSTSLSSILPDATCQTMLMLRGVPPTCMRSELIEMLNDKFDKLYDFLFLPPDIKFQGNKGILFINFESVEKAETFKQAFHEKKVAECFPKFVPEEGDEEKLCSVESAKVDIVESIIARAQTAPPPAKKGVDRSKWQPLLFAPDGESLTFPLIASPGIAGMEMGKTKSQGAKTPKVKAAATVAEADEAVAAATEGAEAAMATPAATPADASADALADSLADTPARANGEKGTKGKGKDRDAKGKGKGKGKDKGQGIMPMYPGYGGYPYGFMPGMYGMHPYAVQAYTAQMYAHMQARAAAAANAAGAGGEPSKLSPEAKKVSLRKQVDFYFSAENLCKDVFLRQHMDEDGYCQLDLIVNFNLIKRKYKASVEDIALAVEGSTILELDSCKAKVRLKDEATRQKWRIDPRTEDAQQ